MNISLYSTVHTTLPVSSASQGVSFARLFHTLVYKENAVALPLYEAHLVTHLR